MTDFIEANGVVGAGGGGFPTAVKLESKAGVFIVNAAECEPLMHKDKELIARHQVALFAGLKEAMDRTGATEGIIGIKAKYSGVIKALSASLPKNVRIHSLSDTYPAGDEFILVWDVTGRVIPPGGLPRDVGAAVANVETLVNIGLARPVTTKFLTVAGAVRRPVTLEVPIGISVAECIAKAGGATVKEYGVLAGGVMMGTLLKDTSAPVTKTTGGLVVLPVDHPVMRRYRRNDEQVRRIGRSACDQCSFCTELCPRYLLGHPIQPHRAMRSLGFPVSAKVPDEGTVYCSECNLCSMVSCPEDLDPRRVCVMDKTEVRRKGNAMPKAGSGAGPNPMLRWRRTPTGRLMRKLGLLEFINEGSLAEGVVETGRVTLLLKQHAGVASVPCVKAGQAVSVGDIVATIPAGQMGANLHASLSGVVALADGAVIIEASA